MMKRQNYLAPDVKVVEVNETDVIRTSKFILGSADLFAGEASWKQTWMEKLQGLEGME